MRRGCDFLRDNYASGVLVWGEDAIPYGIATLHAPDKITSLNKLQRVSWFKQGDCNANLAILPSENTALCDVERAITGRLAP
jgi:hypothetical protein